MTTQKARILTSPQTVDGWGMVISPKISFSMAGFPEGSIPASGYTFPWNRATSWATERDLGQESYGRDGAAAERK